MKFAKRILAVALAVIMTLSLAGCLHQKNETAITVGKVKFTSGQYLYALIVADSEARSIATEQAGDKASNPDFDMYKEKINKKSYVDYVRDTAEKNLARYAAIITKCNELNIKLTKDEKKEVKSTVDSEWTSYGPYMFEDNGVSKETYLSFREYDKLAEKYFMSIYGEDGTSPVSAEDIKNEIYTNNILADILPATTQGLEEDKITEIDTKFNSYVTRLNKGESFAAIYNEYNGVETANDSASEPELDENGVPTAPKDTLAMVVNGKESDSNYTYEFFAPLKDMKVGEAKVYNGEKSGYKAVLVKKDLASDPYYEPNLKITALHDLKDDEFEDTVKAVRKTLKIKVNKSNTERLDVKKITYKTAE